MGVNELAVCCKRTVAELPAFQERKEILLHGFCRFNPFHIANSSVCRRLEGSDDLCRHHHSSLINSVQVLEQFVKSEIAKKSRSFSVMKFNEGLLLCFGDKQTSQRIICVLFIYLSLNPLQNEQISLSNVF